MLGTLLAAATLVVLTPQQKAGLLVVSGLPAPKGVGGVLVQRGTADAQLPPGVLVFADQEGGDVRAFPALPPAQNARDIRNAAESYADGVATARALRTVGVDVDLAPVLDLPDGALGAGADLVLFTSGHDAAEAMRALAPLARRGELDAHAIRVLRFRERLTD